MEEYVQESVVIEKTRVSEDQNGEQIRVFEHVELTKNRNELGDLVVSIDVETAKTTPDSGYNEHADLGLDPRDDLPEESGFNVIVQEDDIRSRHSSGTSIEKPQPIERAPELKQRGNISKENYEQKMKHTELNEQRENEPVKKLRPLLRDFVHQSVDRKPDGDEHDWAKKNIGTGRINNLIARFNQGAVLDDKSENVSPTYKSDYGVGRGKGQLQQDLFR